MSLLLHTLRRIEARHMSRRARQLALPSERIKLLPNVSADVPIEDLPEIDLEPIPEPVSHLTLPRVDEGFSDRISGVEEKDTALPDSYSVDWAMDQIQALVSEAGVANDAEPQFDHASFEVAELPVIEPVHSDPYAATAQSILRQLPDGRPQVLLFTSPSDGHGKTVTLARLAPRLAQGVQGNVLVVDADYRNPDMARWLAIAPAWRLPDVLSGAADWAAAVQATAHERLSLLPGGIEVRGRSGKIPAMGQLLRELARHYELVLVDAASLVHRGAAQLAAVCDATYLVVRLGEVSPRMVREAVQVVAGNGGRLLGCVAIDAGI